MKLSASQAAKAVEKSIPTVTRAIKSAKLSAAKLESGRYEVEPLSFSESGLLCQVLVTKPMQR